MGFFGAKDGQGDKGIHWRSWRSFLIVTLFHYPYTAKERPYTTCWNSSLLSRVTFWEFKRKSQLVCSLLKKKNRVYVQLSEACKFSDWTCSDDVAPLVPLVP
jgi:hypothetical protein